MMTSPYFVPAGGAILRQMQNMRNSGQRIALAVDGTGRVVGMVTVSKFRFRRYRRTRTAKRHKNRQRRFLVSADISLMQLGELFPHTALPTTSATTLNGLVQEHLGNIPDSALCLENRRVACGSDRSKQKSRYKSACFRRPTIIRPTKITHTPHGGVFPFFPPIPATSG